MAGKKKHSISNSNANSARAIKVLISELDHGAVNLSSEPAAPASLSLLLHQCSSILNSPKCCVMSSQTKENRSESPVIPQISNSGRKTLHFKMKKP